MVAIRFFLKTIELFSTKWAAYISFHLFQRTAKDTVRPREESFYERYTTEYYTDDYGKFAAVHNLETKLSNQQEVFLLVHGWNSNLGSMSDIADVLSKENKLFFCFNLPGHGNDGNRKSNVFVSKNRVRFVLSKISTQTRIHLITHSFGSAVTSFALSEENRSFGKLIFLTSPNKIKEVFTDFGNFMQLKSKTVNQVIALGENLLNETANEAEVAKKLVKSLFEKLLIIHDEKDKVIPFKTALEIKNVLTSSQLNIHSGIGHYRMLSNSAVLNEIKEFLN